MENTIILLPIYIYLFKNTLQSEDWTGLLLILCSVFFYLIKLTFKNIETARKVVHYLIIFWLSFIILASTYLFYINHDDVRKIRYVKRELMFLMLLPIAYHWMRKRIKIKNPQIPHPQTHKKLDTSPARTNNDS